MSLDFINTIILLGFIQGLILASVLYKTKEKNKQANKYLAILLVLLSAMFLSKSLLLKYPSVYLFQKLSLLDPIIFLFGPLFYRYLILLLKGNYVVKHNLKYYAPAIVYTGYITYTNIFSLESYSLKLNNGDFDLPFLIAELVALIHNSYFWVLSHNLISRYSKYQRNQFSFYQPSVRFAKISHYGIGFVLFLWLIGFVGTYFLESRSYVLSYNAIWIFLTLLVYIVGYYAIRQPEIFKFKASIALKKQETKDYVRLQAKEIEYLKEKLELLISNEKVFLNNGLTLAEMAKKLKTSSNNLSWLLNKVYKTNFYDFINELRVNEFVKKVENKEHVNRTLLALSLEVGFNSKSTFNKAFKSFKNETPSSFVKRIAQ